MVRALESLRSLNEQQDARIQSLMGRILAAAEPGAVYGEPVTSGSYTIVTASEVMSGGGFGSGFGVGPAGRAPGERHEGVETAAAEQKEISSGGGIGGGGGAHSRPVAIVVVGPDGVKVKPVLDVTKLAIAAIAASLALATAYRRARQGSRA